MKRTQVTLPATAEKRKFNIHPKLLFDVIFRQAGSLAKAILEGIMNSVDAKASKCEIYFDEGGKSLTIVDDGSGIVEKKHIETFFETFGQPHDESEGKVFGTFRMGRGQMFAYGVNKWRTGPWQMIVDAKNRGLDYDLIKQPRSVKGCEIVIELYDPLSPSEYQSTEDLIRKWAKYAPIPVTWNGDDIQVDPDTEKWDHETDEAYIKLNKTGVLSLYNLGVHTMDIAQYHYGTGGAVVTKKQIKVNFARNDVQSDCPVWKKILPFIKQKANEKNLRSSALDDAGRSSLARQLLSGELSWSDIYNAKLVTAVNGRQFTLDSLRYPYRYGDKLTVCKRNDPLGDKIFQQRLAFVIADETLDRFNVKTLKQLETKIKKSNSDFRMATVVDFASITKGMNRDQILLEDSEIKPSERIWKDVADTLLYALDRCFPNKTSRHRRRLAIGVGPAHGWTDGMSYIALSRGFLSKLHFNLQGVCALTHLVLHEMCHDEPDTAEHAHTHEFYEQFHEADRYHGEAVAKGFRRLTACIKRHSRSKKIPADLLRVLDTEHTLQQAKEEARKKRPKKIVVVIPRKVG